MISSYIFSLSDDESFFESPSFPRKGHRHDHDTPAATTGPAQAPLPASSTPITSTSRAIFLEEACFDMLFGWFFRILEENTQVKKNTTFFEELESYRQHFRSYEERPIDDIYAELINWLDHIDTNGKKIIESAFSIAKKAHEGQIRISGKPYISHPLTIACMTLPYSPCEFLISAILLHDVLEDTDVTYEELHNFNPTIAHIVEWVTKIRTSSELERGHEWREEENFETIRKILVASQKDIRILFVKIFDRLHNMITIDVRSPESQIRISQETKNVYVPLAKRCGLREVYHYLRGISTEILEPERWETMETFSKNSFNKTLKTGEGVEKYFKNTPWSKKIHLVEIKYLSPFSIEKTQMYHEDSWLLIQIVVKEATDCYAILHDIGKRQDINLLQIGKIDDFINHPRLSGFEWIHFNVVFHGTKKIKLSVITQESYRMINSHPSFSDLWEIYWPILFRDFELINEATASDSKEFMQSVTEHILARKIPLHSEKNPLFFLPIKSSALDAAIYLMPDIFQYLDSVYRNGEKIPFHTPLENNDILILNYSTVITIQDQWSNLVHSGISKWRIRNHFIHSKNHDRN